MAAITTSYNEKDSVNVVEDARRKKVNLDNILVDEIGQFGRYQIRTLILTVIVIIFSAWGATEYIFTTARIKTRFVVFTLLKLMQSHVTLWY